MLRKVVLPAILLLLAYALWISADFMEIAAGVALFIFGMLYLQEGFKVFTGGTLETLLRHSTDRLWKSLSFGIVSTTVMQSSTLVSLITISFVSAEMITLAAGIGVIMGANIGTTTGAWLIAGLGLRVDIAAYAMPMLVFGVVFLMQSRKPLKGVGYLLMGAGFLFLGIHYMKEGFETFQGTFDLSAYGVTGVTGLLLFTLIGTLITVIMQSSHATLLIIITALASGQVNYENAIALAIGANLGSAVTTGLGGLAANTGGKRLAAAHVVFNLMAAVLGLALINQLTWLVDVSAGLLGIGEEDYMLKLALFHTVYNVMGVGLMLPFIKLLEQQLLKYIPDRSQAAEQPLFLYADALKTPQTAVVAARKEVKHLFDNAFSLLAQGLSLNRNLIESDQSLADAVQGSRHIFPLDVNDAYEEKIKSLHNAIVTFIVDAQTGKSNQSSAEALYVLRQASRNIVEAVKGMKHLHKNLSRHGLSTNPAVRESYDQLRISLAKLLRELHMLLEEEESSASSLSLDSLRLSLQKSGRKVLDNLDEMIRHRRIPAATATSILNDEAYIMEIAENLLDAIRILLENPDSKSAQDLSLDDDEIETLLKNE